MTQTMKGQDTPGPKRPSGNRPGQRQQERLQRIVRRRRRRQRILAIIGAILAVIAASVVIWLIGLYQSNQSQAAAQRALATATVQSAQASATATVLSGQASATAQVYAATPTPVVGAPTPPPNTPPAVDQKPVTLSNGLQYIDITEGGGVPAASGSSLSVIYTGWLQSTGQKFDSSYDDGGQPFSVTLGQGQVIPGFEQGLVGVRAGGTRRLIIPPALAYGSQGSTQGTVAIPPNATLIFDITVVSIQ